MTGCDVWRTKMNSMVKMNHKIIFFSLAIFTIACLFFVNAFSTTPHEDLSSEVINQLDLEETYPASVGSLAIVYDDLDSMISDADLVVYGMPQTSDIAPLDGYSQTHTTFTISDVIKGELSSGDEIEVIEEGGFNGFVAGGIPQLSDSNKYVLFLLEYKGAYYVCGAFQGRFIEKSGYVFQQATEDTKLQRSVYAPIKTDEFISQIRQELEDKGAVLLP